MIELSLLLSSLRRSTPKRLKLTPTDRLFWVWLRRVWSNWRSPLLIVQPETVLAWHREGFRLFWKWKIRHGKPGRPAVPPEVRDLIRIMSRNNPRWDAPRIHSELLKLGIDSTEPTVAKYMLRQRKPPSHSLQFFTLYCVLGNLRRRASFTVEGIDGFGEKIYSYLPSPKPSPELMH